MSSTEKNQTLDKFVKEKIRYLTSDQIYWFMKITEVDPEDCLYQILIQCINDLAGEKYIEQFVNEVIGKFKEYEFGEILMALEMINENLKATKVLYKEKNKSNLLLHVLEDNRKESQNHKEVKRLQNITEQLLELGKLPKDQRDPNVVNQLFKQYNSHLNK
jgi:hypothetical protein